MYVEVNGERYRVYGTKTNGEYTSFLLYISVSEVSNNWWMTAPEWQWVDVDKCKPCENN